MPGSHPVRWIICLLSGALAAFGCAGTETSQGGETGSLSVDLVLAGGVVIDQVEWGISGNGMDMAGSIDVSAPGSTASVEVFGLPPGMEPYVVELSATSVDKEVTCRGSAPFDIEVGVSTEVMVMLNCKLPPEYGGVRVNGKFNICAQLTKVIVSPLQTSVGNDISLFSAATDEEGDPIATMWSSDSGSIADPTATSTTYTCTEVGDDDITVLVSDDDGTYCMSMWTVRVTCVAGEGNPCDDVICEDDGNECTAEACNPSSGQCESTPVDDGTSCDDGSGVCMSGECAPNDLCTDVTCEDDGNECTAELCNPGTGQCETSNVDDGTACGDGGACMGGTCIVSDLCAEVVCDDTGNDCTVGVCNNQTGVCDVMNVTNGTACNGGTGACSAGECLANNLCESVDCTSSNECVQDGVCDPADASCTPGDNEAAGTACTMGGSVCDGGGTCVECNDAGDCGTGQICEQNLCVTPPDCTTNADCDDGNQCTVNSCVDEMCVDQNQEEGATCDQNGGAVCDGSGGCVECVMASMCPSGGECQVATCNANACGLSNATDGTACGDGGMCMSGQCEVGELVIGTGSGSTGWNAQPKQATGCTYDSVNTICTGCTVSATGVPGGGACAQFGAQVVQGCEVPGGVLNSQLALDVFVTLDASSTGDGNITTDYTIVAENPALSTAAGLVTVDSADLLSSVTSGTPSELTNSLDPAIAGNLLGFFTGGTNILILDDEILQAVTPVTPTSSPTVDVNFSGNFLIGLTITASGTALNVDSASCTFDNPAPNTGAPITFPVQ